LNERKARALIQANTSDNERLNDPEVFLAGGGEMGALIRAMHWKDTSLGEPTTWPQALRTAVRLLLNSGHPMYIFWGEEGACFYNDAYRASIGPERHPSSLGRPAREVWAEIWDIIGPQIEQVMAGGRATWHENALVPITRYGEREDVYWTYSFGPIDDLTAPRGVGGVLVVTSETTQAVRMQRLMAFQLQLDDTLRTLEQPREVMNAAAAALGEYLEVDRCGYGEVDHSGTQLIVGGDWTTAGMPELSGRLSLAAFGSDVMDTLAEGASLRIDDIHAHPLTRQATAAFAAAGDMQSAVIVPLIKNGRMVAIFYVHQSSPRSWRDEEAVLVEHVAERTWDAVERARAEAALHSGERDLEFALHAGRLGAWSLNIGTSTLTSSRSLRESFGRDPEKAFSYQDFCDAIHAEDRERFLESLATCVEQGSDLDISFRIITPPGVLRWIGMHGQPGIDGEGIARTISGVTQDITRTRAADSRRAALIRLADLLNTIEAPSDIAFAAAEVLGSTLEVSRVGYGTIDVAAETISIARDWNAPGIKSLAGIHHFRDYGTYIEDLKKGRTVVFADARQDPRTSANAAALEAISARSVVNMPVTEQSGFVALLYLNHTNARTWTDEELELIRDVAQRTRMAIERRRAEQETRALNQYLEQEVEQRTEDLRRSESRLRTIFETSLQYQGTLDLDGTLRDANATALAGIGMSLSDVSGRHFWDIPWFSEMPGLSEVLREAVMTAAAGETVRQSIHTRIQGEWRWFDMAMRPMRDDEGTIVGIIQEAVETTQRHHAEEQLRQAQKLEAVGKLTGGIAHDFNNLLQVIGGNLQLLGKDLPDRDSSRLRLENAMAGVTRGARLASQLLAFARRQPLVPRAVNLSSFLHGMEDMLHRSLGEGIETEIVAADDLWSALVDPSQAENAMLNLAINARDAMEGRGRLLIKAGNVVLEDTDVAGHDDVEPGDYVMLAISDTGSGMSKEIIDRAFEPFYTTKADGHGTGLGLSMVWGLVKQSKGHIQISSTIGSGTTVRLYLPRSLEVAEELALPHPDDVKGGSETILLVEDHDFVRLTEAEMLRELGYHVLEAADAQQAMTMIDEGLRPDLLFTDVIMPGPLRSTELASRARERFPGLPVLYASGYSEEAIIHDGRLDPGVELLGKPFSRSDLAHRLRLLLDGAQMRPAPDEGQHQENMRQAGKDGEPCVLLVEDDALIRMATADLLSDLGYRCTEAGSGEDALAVLAGENVDILMTDIGLPGMSGRDLVVQARKALPDLRVILASGADALPEGETNAGARTIMLIKPFGEQELSAALDKIMA
jgi:PAS domain S-box-containing protein